jgi:hypothetical protein
LDLVDKDMRVYRCNALLSRMFGVIGRRPFPFSLMAVPDAAIWWVPYALIILRKLLRSAHYDLLYTVSSPPSAHIVGLILSRYVDIPWFAFLSDPLTENIAVRPNLVSRAFSRELEGRIFEKANSLGFTWSHGRDWALRRYPQEVKDKANIVPHCFSSRLLSKGVHTDSMDLNRLSSSKTKFRIIHAGRFYGSRDANILLETIALLRAYSSDVFNSIEVLLLGGLSKPLCSAISARHLTNIVFPTKIEPYMSTLEMLSTASVLVLIDVQCSFSPYFPSKLVDYLYVGKPILAFTAGTGPTADILRTAHHAIITSYDPQEAAKLLLNYLRSWSLSGKLPIHTAAADGGIANEFDARIVGRRHAETLAKLRRR